MPDALPDWLHELDHTGDVGFDLEAPSLDSLFARAAWALFSERRVCRLPDGFVHGG